MSGRPTILVVDNESSFRASCAETLLASGYNMRSASNRTDAEEAMFADLPDLVLLGTIAPRGDACALLKWIRRTVPFTATPVIVIDAPVQKQLLSGWCRDEGRRLEAEDYLVKPVDPAAVLPRIAKLLDTTTHKVKVLVVDDHAMVRDGIRAVLSLQRDMQVVGEADNGKVAVQRVMELDPDVVLMDLLMPEMNGLEATREICRTPHHAKILMLTQYDDEENVQASKEAGAWCLIPKKDASGELVGAIRSATQAF
jgi:DNA-binding NarL/FixJ family response regulator